MQTIDPSLVSRLYIAGSIHVQRRRLGVANEIRFGVYDVDLYAVLGLVGLLKPELVYHYQLLLCESVQCWHR